MAPNPNPQTYYLIENQLQPFGFVTMHFVKFNITQAFIISNLVTFRAFSLLGWQAFAGFKLSSSGLLCRLDLRCHVTTMTTITWQLVHRRSGGAHIHGRGPWPVERSHQNRTTGHELCPEVWAPRRFTINYCCHVIVVKAVIWPRRSNTYSPASDCPTPSWPSTGTRSDEASVKLAIHVKKRLWNAGLTKILAFHYVTTTIFTLPVSVTPVTCVSPVCVSKVIS